MGRQKKLDTVVIEFTDNIKLRDLHIHTTEPLNIQLKKQEKTVKE